MHGIHSKDLKAVAGDLFENMITDSKSFPIHDNGCIENQEAPNFCNPKVESQPKDYEIDNDFLAD